MELEPTERASLGGICWAGFDGRTFAVSPLQQALAHLSAQLGRKVRLAEVTFSAVDAVELRLRTQRLIEAVYPVDQHAARMRAWVEECQPLVAVYLPPGVAEVAVPEVKWPKEAEADGGEAAPVARPMRRSRRATDGGGLVPPEGKAKALSLKGTDPADRSAATSGTHE